MPSSATANRNITTMSQSGVVNNRAEEVGAALNNTRAAADNNTTGFGIEDPNTTRFRYKEIKSAQNNQFLIPLYIHPSPVGGGEEECKERLIPILRLPSRIRNPSLQIISGESFTQSLMQAYREKENHNLRHNDNKNFFPTDIVTNDKCFISRKLKEALRWLYKRKVLKEKPRTNNVVDANTGYQIFKIPLKANNNEIIGTSITVNMKSWNLKFHFICSNNQKALMYSKIVIETDKQNLSDWMKFHEVLNLHSFRPQLENTILTESDIFSRIISLAKKAQNDISMRKLMLQKLPNLRPFIVFSNTKERKKVQKVKEFLQRTDREALAVMSTWKENDITNEECLAIDLATQEVKIDGNRIISELEVVSKYHGSQMIIFFMLVAFITPIVTGIFGFMACLNKPEPSLEPVQENFSNLAANMSFQASELDIQQQLKYQFVQDEGAETQKGILKSITELSKALNPLPKFREPSLLAMTGIGFILAIWAYFSWYFDFRKKKADMINLAATYGVIPSAETASLV